LCFIFELLPSRLTDIAVGVIEQALIESDFTEEGGLDRAIQLVTAGGGIVKARDLARSEAEQVHAAFLDQAAAVA
jgi:hypothetical protein